MTTFPNLKSLNYDPFDISYQLISFVTSPPSVFSSILLELHVKVMRVQDCLHLLDGRFNQLRVFNVKMQSSVPLISKIYKGKLLNLRDFSLSCTLKINFYDTVVVPLLHRMSNLEHLRLYFHS
ncbi:unnamed protein product [Rotaria magnacalcarata]|uniref:Uncharacterized protein n=2 Tax=Rotaria magnacalcarata TaxID=392030 RepID=A0A816X167_9BILA|nr:unnamed protein product [Rotaria magnacalcarata]CAF1350373.1 unnamed protein product [Rotaria magnacalcarata]CAF2141306.1 unnamed protein product [Rotaria magnacalcarata]CAF4164985.1 unnamed protein product [Rotaria magnacalcarata]CAF4569906.1 unnamed protein product [Rotaria magnacalcarata]